MFKNVKPMRPAKYKRLLRAQLDAYEKKYAMTTEEMYDRVVEGEMDDGEVMGWLFDRIEWLRIEEQEREGYSFTGPSTHPWVSQPRKS